MFRVLVNILLVLVARENAASLGAPDAKRLFHTKLPVINYTAQQTEAVPVDLTHRKVSVNVPKQIYPHSFRDEENLVTIPYQQPVNTKLKNNDTEEFNLHGDSIDTTERTATTVYDFQSSTTQERSFEELLNLARTKYLGHNLRYRCQYVHILTRNVAMK